MGGTKLTGDLILTSVDDGILSNDTVLGRVSLDDLELDAPEGETSVS